MPPNPILNQVSILPVSTTAYGSIQASATSAGGVNRLATSAGEGLQVVSTSFTGTFYATDTLAVSVLSTAQGAQSLVYGNGEGVTVTLVRGFS